MSAKPEPKIVAFLCCGGCGSEYPSNVKVVKVTCAERLDADAIIGAFFDGVDGVLVGNCVQGECHYPAGNQDVERRINNARRLLDLMGVDRNRLRLEAVTGGDALKGVLADFSARLSDLGPHVLKVPEIDKQVLDRIVRWVDALDGVYAPDAGEKVPAAKGAVFSQAFRLAVPVRANIPEAESWITADPTTCVGCRICEAVCSESHEGIINPALARLSIAYDAFKQYPQIYCKQDICKHCTGADCMAACPNGALNVDSLTGARYIDPNLCTGCRSCQEACQWGLITYVPEKNICIKCDLCGGDPECVKACPAGALKYVSTKGGAKHARVAG